MNAVTIITLAYLGRLRLGLLSGTCINLGTVAIYTLFEARGYHVHSGYLYTVYASTVLGIIVEAVAFFKYRNSDSPDSPESNISYLRLVLMNDFTAFISVIPAMIFLVKVNAVNESMNRSC